MPIAFGAPYAAAKAGLHAYGNTEGGVGVLQVGCPLSGLAHARSLTIKATRKKCDEPNFAHM